MKALCIFGHDWTGCRCDRCGELRDRDHEWDGCRCLRCSLVRNQDHDWERTGCRLKCRRCGHHDESSHDWLGCVCQRCKTTKHCWLAGQCAHCGERCPHVNTVPMSEGEEACSGHTAHFTHDHYRNVCKECGMTLPARK